MHNSPCIHTHPLLLPSYYNGRQLERPVYPLVLWVPCPFTFASTFSSSSIFSALLDLIHYLHIFKSFPCEKKSNSSGGGDLGDLVEKCWDIKLCWSVLAAKNNHQSYWSTWQEEGKNLQLHWRGPFLPRARGPEALKVRDSCSLQAANPKSVLLLSED